VRHDLDTNRSQEATLVVDGVIYTPSASSKVQAFDADGIMFIDGMVGIKDGSRDRSHPLLRDRLCRAVGRAQKTQ
jgi:hypothetical protein